MARTMQVGLRSVTIDWSATINGVDDWPVVVYAKVRRHGPTFHEPALYEIDEWRAEASKVRADENGEPIEVRDENGGRVYEDVTEQVAKDKASMAKMEERLFDEWWRAA